jgi:hypothetical protein
MLSGVDRLHSQWPVAFAIKPAEDKIDASLPPMTVPKLFADVPKSEP